MPVNRFLMAMEFMLSLVQDGSLFPGSSTMDTRNARARWVTGVGGQFLDGPWNPGVIADNFPEFMELTGVSQIPVMESGQTPIVYDVDLLLVNSSFPVRQKTRKLLVNYSHYSQENNSRSRWLNVWINHRLI